MLDLTSASIVAINPCAMTPNPNKWVGIHVKSGKSTHWPAAGAPPEAKIFFDFSGFTLDFYEYLCPPFNLVHTTRERHSSLILKHTDAYIKHLLVKLFYMCARAKTEIGCMLNED